VITPLEAHKDYPMLYHTTKAMKRDFPKDGGFSKTTATMTAKHDQLSFCLSLDKD